MDPIFEIIKNNIAQTKIRSGGRITGFAIGSTSKNRSDEDRGAYPTPVRQTDTLVYSGVIVDDLKNAAEISRFVDGKVDTIFVDTEDKHSLSAGPGRIENKIRSVITKSDIVTYKGNDITVSALDALIAELGKDIENVTVAVVGCGNLGAKICLKLIERGVNVQVYRRNQNKIRKIIQGLTEIQLPGSGHIFEKHDVLSACAGAHIIVATTGAVDIINSEHVQCAHKETAPLLIDVGKGAFAKEVVEQEGILVYRLDVSVLQKHIFSALVENKEFYSKTIGRKTIGNNDLTIVSLGVLGRYGEIIVDDIDAPSRIFGIADGKGVLLKDVSAHKKKLSELQSLYNILE